MLRVMHRKASDNKYLHRDFHISTDVGLAYVGENLGSDAVEEYLEQFARAHYVPLVKDFHTKDLAALHDYFARIYAIEEAEDAIRFDLSEEVLHVEISYCPAVSYMKSTGHEPSRWYRETTSVMYRVLAEMLDLTFTLERYDEENGATAFNFSFPEVQS